MYNICRRMIGDPDEAKDALQDAFTDAFLKLDTFPGFRKVIQELTEILDEY